MCMIDNSDGYIQLLKDSMPKARKDHRCSECGRTIGKGEKYKYEVGIWENSLDVFKTCNQCLDARSWLLKECNGWVYTGVLEDLREHWDYTPTMKLGRLIVSMKRQWKPFRKVA